MSNNDNIEELMYDSKYLIETEVLESGLKKVKIKEIKLLGKKFHDNLHSVCYMIMLPHILLSLEHAKRSLVPYEIMAGLKARIEMIVNHAGDEGAYNYYSKARNEVFESEVLPKIPTTTDEAMASGEKTFLDMLQENQMNLRETYKALLYSGAVWIWCSFEVLMKELWELALNIGGRYISKNAIKSLPESDGLGNVFRGKYISVDYLASYNYNLSNQLGSALSYKFDFTSPNGIKEAYLRAFPKSANIREALNNEKIIELEATRSVIVHNAGIIDEEFCKKTNTNKAEVGKELELNSRKVGEYGNSIIDIGLRIMIAISSIVLYAKSLKRN